MPGFCVKAAEFPKTKTDPRGALGAIEPFFREIVFAGQSPCKSLNSAVIGAVRRVLTTITTRTN